MIDILIPRFDPADPHSAVENMKLLADKSEADILAFVHDDVKVHADSAWMNSMLEEFFKSNPKCGMVGFGGATGLGTPDLYKRPYKLEQLARIRFMSNMTDAEAHGKRVTVPHQVAVLDGFCQIIRREAYEDVGGWQAVLDLGIQFHMYDAAMALLLAEKEWEVWMLPIPCTHHGGRTSCSPEYDAWLRSQGIDGDSEVHQKAHKIIYNRFRKILPLKVR
jgi:GT2 family glycosyltransferase